MWLYQDFLQIDQRYYPVFSEETDRDEPNYWQTFIPHVDMVRILDGYVKALEGVLKKSLWIHGAYGTGKTHAQFVLKHLTEASPEEVTAYFTRHGLGKDLLKRLFGVRDSCRGLVVYRSSAGSIDSQRRLMLELQVSIKKALASQGMEDSVPDTLYDQVLAKLDMADSVLDWKRVFERHRGEYADFASSEVVLQTLRAGRAQGGSMELMGRVARSLEAEGFFLMDDPKTIKDWIKTVISRNRLGYLVFMWDEFTDFFRSQPPLTGLQDLAQLSAEAPFFLLLTTHRSPDLLRQHLGTRQEDWRKLEDRFEVFDCKLQLATAYQLLGKALICKDEEGQRWGWERKSLWESVRLGAKPFLGTNDKLADLEALVPLHPYAAYLLSQLSRQFSSSQRTLFRFLRHDVSGSFSQFLGTHPHGEWKWYTADGLWDYFFGGDTFELPTGFKEVVSYYGSRQAGVVDDFQTRALKATLLLIGLSREIAGDSALQPTLSNLRCVYSGTPLGDKIESVMLALAKNDLVHIINQGTDQQYTIALGTVDPAVTDKYAEELRFDTIVQSAQEMGSIGYTARQVLSEVGDSMKRRLLLTIVSADELKRRREHVITPAAPYQLNVVAVLCCRESELSEASELIARLSASHSGVAFVLAQAAFGEQRWEEWRQAKAHVRWHRDHQDGQNATYYENVATNRVKDWSAQLRAGQLRIYQSASEGPAPEVTVAEGVVGYTRALEQLVATRFPWRPEVVCEIATVHRDKYGKAGAEAGLGLGKASAPYNVAVGQLQQQGIWPGPGQLLSAVCVDKPGHPVSQMKRQVDSVFAGQDSVTLESVWQRLQEPPFGYFPSPLTTLLMGAALRDYVDGYYWRDGVNTRPLDPTKMAALIESVLRGETNITLTRNTPEAREFCELLRDIFSLNPEESKYPQNARDALRKLLSAAGYPLWSLGYASSAPLGGLTALLVPLADRSEGQAELANERIASVVAGLRSDRDRLTELVQQGSFEPGMRRFIEDKCPELLESAHDLGCPLSALMVDLRLLLQQETWLWTEEAVAQRLPTLQAELRLILAMNRLLGEHQTTLASLLESLRLRLQTGKLPLFALTYGATESAKPVLTALSRALETADLSVDEKLALAKGLEGECERVRAALADSRAALQAWSAAQLDTALSGEESSQILLRLSESSSTMSSSDLEDAVRRGVQDLKKRKLALDLREAWRNVTGTADPDEWSRKYGMPVEWLLDSRDDGQLLAVLRSPESRTEQELDAAMARLCGSDTAVNTLNQPGRADRVFAEVALPGYASLIETPETLAALRSRLLDAVSDPCSWERGQVNQLAVSWFREVYEAQLRPKLRDRLASLTDQQARQLLEDLCQDPVFGAKLLQRMSS